jgi:deoxyinosine 3'endonuclease (endonuclease V)
MSKLAELILEFKRSIEEETGVSAVVSIELKDNIFNDILREYSYDNRHYPYIPTALSLEVDTATLYGIKLVKESYVEKQKLELENYAKIKKITLS